MSKVQEGSMPPAYTAVGQPGAPAYGQPGGSYPDQQVPASGYAAYSAPPPAYSQGQQDKMGYNTQAAYQGQYAAQPGYPPIQAAQVGPDGHPILIQPQTFHMVPMMANPPETHMLFAVLSTLCCCWPIGIFAIIKAMEVSSAISRGDRVQAETSSQRAYQLAKYSVIAGVVCSVVCIVFLIIFYAVLFNWSFDD